MVDALHQEPKGSAGREAARSRLLGGVAVMRAVCLERLRSIYKKD